MGKGKKEPKSELQRLFVERLTKEMEDRGISDNALAKASEEPGRTKISQTMISAIKRYEKDATLGRVHAITQALGLPAWFLMTQEGQSEQRVIRPPQNVVNLPSPYPKIFGSKSEDQSKKSHARRKRQ